MKSPKLINTDPDLLNSLSSRACALLFRLYVVTGKDNLVNKSEFIAKNQLFSNPKTWNKYWNELVNNNILVKVATKTWMISPHCCHEEGSSRDLVKKWNQACN